jgi:hypothetical protein
VVAGRTRADGDPRVGPVGRPGQSPGDLAGRAQHPRGRGVFLAAHSLPWYTLTPLGEPATAAGTNDFKPAAPRPRVPPRPCNVDFTFIAYTLKRPARLGALRTRNTSGSSK